MNNKMNTLKKMLQNAENYANDAREEAENTSAKITDALDKLKEIEESHFTINEFIELMNRVKCSYNSLNVFNDIFKNPRGGVSYQHDKLFTVYKGDVANWMNYLDSGNRRLLREYYRKDLSGKYENHANLSKAGMDNLIDSQTIKLSGKPNWASVEV